MAASIPMMTTTASNSTSVKPPSSVLRSSSIRHENQEGTLLPFFLHTFVTAGPPHAPRTYSAIRTGTFSASESEPRPWRIEPKSGCRTQRWSKHFPDLSTHQDATQRPLVQICYQNIPEMLTRGRL